MGKSKPKTQSTITARLNSDPSLSLSSFPRTAGLSLTHGTRRIGYAIYGSATPSSTLLFFHGTPGTRFFFTASHAQLAHDHNIRVLVPERPGFGLSDPQPNRTIMDGADDAKRILDYLGVDKCSVIGYSAGGPYALAFGNKHSQMCDAIAIVSGVGFWGKGAMKGMDLLSKLGWLIAGYMPKMVRPILKMSISTELKDVREGKLAAFSKQEGNWFRTNEQVRRMLVESVSELYSRDCGVQAEAKDYTLFSHRQGWGFDLADIRGKVFMYSGGMDTKCGHGMFAIMKSQIQTGGATVVSRFEEEEDHFMFYRIFEDILKDLNLIT